MAKNTGTLIAGFLKGATGYALDNMTRREQTQAEMKKLEMLERLRMETEKEMQIFRDRLSSKKVDRGLSSADYKRGKFVQRNDKGEVVSERDLSDSEKEAYVLDRRKDELGLQNIESTIASRARDDARQDRVANASIAASNRSNRGLDGSDSGSAKTKVLLAEFKNAFDSMKSSGANEYELTRAQAAWYDGVNNKGWTPSQQRTYINTLLNTWSGKVKALSDSGLLPSQVKRSNDDSASY